MICKPGARVIGIDDAPPLHGKALVVGVIGRLIPSFLSLPSPPVFRHRACLIDGILSTHVTVDGDDATSSLLTMVESSRFKENLRIVFLHTITLAGFNVVDITYLSQQLGIPVICVSRKKPNMSAVAFALAKVSHSKEKFNLMKNQNIYQERGHYFYQYAGCTRNEVREAIRMFGAFPEVVRIAHLISGGIIRGESRGKA